MDSTVASTIVEVMPEGSLEQLSQHEVNRLRDAGEGEQHEMLRCCALAVLNVGGQTDDTREVLKKYQDFDVTIVQQDRGVKLALRNPPPEAFVNGRMIRGIRELLFAVLRDVVYINSEAAERGRFDLATSDGITNAVFNILRNADTLRSGEPDLVVCWGGHAISREEYEYSKLVGYELGLRELSVCTGCGGGAMKGPMKGAAIGHAKQRIKDGRYLGITEPSIIAAESPNPIVNQLVIMPDMEKRLEAFARVAHAIVIFPGGVGTAEEFLFLLGVLLDERNRELPLPVILTGPASSGEYFAQIDAFIADTLCPAARNRYRICVGNPAELADLVAIGVRDVHAFRQKHSDAYYFNWRLHLDMDFQRPFRATHASMAGLDLHRNQSSAKLAANLRKAFSGIVSGNVKDEGIRAIERHGPFQLSGDRDLMTRLDRLLSAFVAQRRMKLPGRTYQPCYRIAV
ncbi:MAG: LOG family protein [Gammaproteobacteria bacterium]|nr:LOG family protein [Gammaproteobacteria bacterium]